MFLSRRRRLKMAAMVGDSGPGKSTRAATQPPLADAASAENRIDALTKLKALFDSGVLTAEQYEAERDRLTAGI
jgi:Short C-terminal domain